MRPLIDAGLTGQISAPDLIGHGASPAPLHIAQYRVDAQIAQLVAVLDGLGAAPVDLIGYSMGARLALSLALARPHRVRRLVLLSGRAGIDDADARAARVARDEALGDRIERDGIQAFATRWATLPIFASQTAPVRAAQHAVRLAQRATGLAQSLRGFGAGAMPPLHTRLASVTLPVCLVAGALDPKFVGLAQGLTASLPDAELHVIERVGHAMHLEAPQQTAAIVNTFLRRPFP
jgi:2-succinyl-6-hydroxy-2,4-cyclohexadiene-1-carboxylate synthase